MHHLCALDGTEVCLDGTEVCPVSVNKTATMTSVQRWRWKLNPIDGSTAFHSYNPPL
jgi:hypothetical protein